MARSAEASSHLDPFPRVGVVVAGVRANPVEILPCIILDMKPLLRSGKRLLKI